MPNSKTSRLLGRKGRWESRGGRSWRLFYWARPISLSPENFKDFSSFLWGGGEGGDHFYHSDVRPFSLSSNARLLLSYHSWAKVFSCFSLIVSIYYCQINFFCYTGHGSVLFLKCHWMYWQRSRVFQSWNHASTSWGTQPNWETRPIGEACLVSTLISKAKKLKASVSILDEREVEDSRRKQGS